MPSESPQKSLEMRVAELEDKLAKLQAASQPGAAQYVPPCVAHYIPPCTQQAPYIPPCTQQYPYIPPCTQQVPAQYSGVPPCVAYTVLIPPCSAYHPPPAPDQGQGGVTAIPPCSGAGKKKDQSDAAKDPSCDDFGGLGT